MAWTLQTVSVAATADGVATFTIGPESYTLPYDRIKAVASGREKSIDTLLAYIGITAALSGADVSTPAKAKAFIDSRQWPW